MVEDLYDTVLIYIKCRKLEDMEFIGVSDPQVVVSQFNKKANAWEELARTEIQKNQLNPDFQPIEMKYFLEKRQQLKF
jgi:hypothetical protein